LLPGKRIVQAWRVANWEPGKYSPAKFELSEQGSAIRIVSEHTGFPKGEGQHLAEGWNGNHGKPLAEFLE